MYLFLKKNPLWLGIGLLCTFCALLVFMRIFYTQERTFLFLGWNLFLAIVPIIWMELEQRKSDKMGGWAFFALSILFLPNAPYLITDLFHLKLRNPVPLWYDTLMFFVYSLTGLVLFYWTLIKMEAFLLKKMANKIYAYAAILVILLMCAFGIYLGRYLRFNSWDVVADPLGLMTEIFDRILHPFAHPRAWGVTIGYGLFFIFGFSFVKILQMAARVEAISKV